MAEKDNFENSTAPASLVGRLVIPLKMNSVELDKRINSALRMQHKYAANSNFHLSGWEIAKIEATIKAVLIEFGLVELVV